MSKEKEVFVDVKTVVQFEQELIKTVKNNQVAVVDVYNSEWGRCKAVVEFLKRLFYENNNLKLFCLDVDAILENYNGAYLSKKKKMTQDQPPDTIPDNWIPLIKVRQGFSKPYFLFYKDGKLVHEINGVNAPLIQDYVKDLCAVKIPASEFITNPRLLEVWEENFSAEESEVSWEKWLRQLTSSILKLNVPLDDAERRLMLEALKISPNAREKIVTAENLQNWLGDEEKSILQVFTELLPDYEDRAQKFLIQQQEEERIRAEKEAMERAEEELRKQQRDAQMLIEKQKREEEEELLKADRIAREQFEMSPEHIAQIEQEISTLTTTIQESEQVLKGMGPDAEEILPYSLESLIVSHEFSSFCTEHVNKNQVHPISERHSTVSRVFTALEGVEKILSVLNDLICTLQNVGIKDYIGNISSVLHLSDSETICFAHILMHEINSREHEQAPFVLEILGQYLLTGDAAELTIKSDDGTVPAIYPKLHEICSNPLLPGMMEHMALWIPIMLSEYRLLTELEVGCAMKAPESDADIRTIGAQVCFPFLILEENPQLKNEAEYMNITMKGGFHGLPLIGSAFVQDRSKCYLLKPFTWCRVESVNENSMMVCVDESNHKSEAYGALEDAVKSTNDKWKGLNQIMKALGSWQADSNRVGLLSSRLQELTVKQNTSLDGTKQEDALQGSEHEASMHSELVDDTVNASPESPVEGSPEKKLSTEEKELDEIEKLE